MNKAILFGNVGKDPEVRNLESGKKVAKFPLATNKSYTNQQGEKITDTSWHNIVLWNKLAELAEKYVKKGSSIIIEGEISYRSYENKEGQTIYTTDIIGDRLHFAGGPKNESKPETKERESIPGTNKVKMESLSNINELPDNVADYDDIPDDGIPFL
jgi:single-strand DNA-binding protein